MLNINGIMAYDQETAFDVLYSFGLDRMDAEQLTNLLCEDIVLTAKDAEYSADVARQEHRAIESYCDHVQSVLNEVLSIVDEALEMERISKPRERLESIRNLIDKEL